MAGWQHFQHVADIGVHGWGTTPEEAYAQAALALTAVITDPQRVRPAEPREITCTAPDRALLLADWLNALVYAMATQRMLFSRFDVTLHDDGLHARIWGEALDRVRQAPAVEVKGATYTGLAVTRDAGGIWHARCVVDV